MSGGWPHDTGDEFAPYLAKQLCDPEVRTAYEGDDMSDEKRVVLVKPGDVLLIGNVRGASYGAVAEAMERFKKLTGIASVVLFFDDIQLDLLTGKQLSDLTERAAHQSNAGEAS